MKVRATTPKAVTIPPVEQTARSVAREEHLEAADRGGVGGGVEAVERLGLAAPQEQQAGGPVPFDDRRARRRGDLQPGVPPRGGVDEQVVGARGADAGGERPVEPAESLAQ